MKTTKGIILAGGTGSRLYPLTLSTSKQLMPIYDKPMIYYPLSVLMLSGIREVAIITTPQDQFAFKHLLKDGSQWGMKFEYIEQPSPDGLAQAYILAEDFLDGQASAMILGDNIYYGHGLPLHLKRAVDFEGSTVFGYQVRDPHRYGVVGFDENGQVNSIEEKPEKPKSDFAMTGLYFLDASAPERAKKVKPSARGELEITSLIETYMFDKTLNVEKLGRGYAWLDTGTHESLLQAGEFVRTVEDRQGLKIGCPEEISYRQGWVDKEQLRQQIKPYLKTQYGIYLEDMINE
jgi:glucose-1-phosphate thymidylyltransferase